MIRVAVVCPWFYKGDAVGAAARDTYVALKDDPSIEVVALGTHTGFADVPIRHVGTASELLASQEFLSADVIIYHFAIYHDLFNAIFLGNGHAKQVLRFHNVTPRRFMPRHTWETIDRSFLQLRALSCVDEAWADSRENAMELIAQGFLPEGIRVEPLAVDRPDWTRLSDKGADSIEAVFVGRFFSSKGVHDLVAAVADIRQKLDVPFRVRLVGNPDFSDPAYVAGIRLQIIQEGLAEAVELTGGVNAKTLELLYGRAHILATASYHEGFCVPVIEGLRAGCIPVTTDAGNLRFISGGIGRTVATGDPVAYGSALLEVVASIPRALSRPEDPLLKLDCGAISLREFEMRSQQHAETFSFANLRKSIKQRIHALAEDSAYLSTSIELIAS